MLRSICMSLSVMTLVVLMSMGFGLAAGSREKAQGYKIVDTGLRRCYGNWEEISCPKRGRPFFGQDAEYVGNRPAYKDNGNGTISDLNTGLMWQKTPDFVTRSWKSAGEYAKSLVLAGHDDWRLPTIKELFSIADFRGNIRTRTPYIDTRYFGFRYPDTSKGVRIIDAQYWSSNVYVGLTMRGDRSAFGFNFADGRIKSYPMLSPQGRVTVRDRRYVRCVRGPCYGRNDFVDNGDGTISDRATGLMWMKRDSGKRMNWQAALAYAEKLKYAGYDDWRLPNVKELQSIVNYGRAPDARSPSARGPAIDPIFDLSKPESWFWTSTTHVENMFGYYVAFGQAFSAWKRQGKLINAHGAGAVRSDPKAGNPAKWRRGLGPQGDLIRILNYVRCVRGGAAKLKIVRHKPLKRPSRRSPGQAGLHIDRFIGRLDRNGDGKISRSEFDGPPAHFSDFDRDRDGFISADEAPTGPPPRRPRRGRPPGPGRPGGLR